MEQNAVAEHLVQTYANELAKAQHGRFLAEATVAALRQEVGELQEQVKTLQSAAGAAEDRADG